MSGKNELPSEEPLNEICLTFGGSGLDDIQLVEPNNSNVDDNIPGFRPIDDDNPNEDTSNDSFINREKIKDGFVKTGETLKDVGKKTGNIVSDVTSSPAFGTAVGLGAMAGLAGVAAATKNPSLLQHIGEAGMVGTAAGTAVQSTSTAIKSINEEKTSSNAQETIKGGDVSTASFTKNSTALLLSIIILLLLLFVSNPAMTTFYLEKLESKLTKTTEFGKNVTVRHVTDMKLLK